MSKFAGALVAITIAFSTSQASPLDSPTVQDAVPEMEDYTPKASAATQLRTAETSAATQLATDEFVTVEGNGNGKNKRRRKKRRRKASSSPTKSPTTYSPTKSPTKSPTTYSPTKSPVCKCECFNFGRICGCYAEGAWLDCSPGPGGSRE